MSETDQPHLQRKLGARHLNMIAIGGSIGTGLFLASGATIAIRRAKTCPTANPAATLGRD